LECTIRAARQDRKTKRNTTLGLTTQIRWATEAVHFYCVGGWRPSVLWHFLTDNLRYLLLKLGVLSGAAKHVAEIHAAFEAPAAQGEFKESVDTRAGSDKYQYNATSTCETLKHVSLETVPHAPRVQRGQRRARGHRCTCCHNCWMNCRNVIYVDRSHFADDVLVRSPPGTR
jgi:hypothetical protein